MRRALGRVGAVLTGLLFGACGDTGNSPEALPTETEVSEIALFDELEGDWFVVSGEAGEISFDGNIASLRSQRGVTGEANMEMSPDCSTNNLGRGVRITVLASSDENDVGDDGCWEFGPIVSGTVRVLIDGDDVYRIQRK